METEWDQSSGVFLIFSSDQLTGAAAERLEKSLTVSLSPLPTQHPGPEHEPSPTTVRRKYQSDCGRDIYCYSDERDEM